MQPAYPQSVSQIFAKDNSALFTYGSLAVLFTAEL